MLLMTTSDGGYNANVVEVSCKVTEESHDPI